MFTGIMNTTDEFKDFNVNDISKEQLRKLRVDANGGYKQIGQSYNAWGDKRGDYNKGTNFGYYQSHTGWSEIAKELGIKNIDSNNDISQMYDFTNSYSRSSSSAPSQSYGNAPSSQGQSSVNFSNQLAAIKAQNQASMDALTKQLSDQKADYDAREVASNKKISGLASTVANAQSQYDPTKGMGSSNNINPALTIQEKSNSLSSGTQRYNRGKLSINNLNV